MNPQVTALVPVAPSLDPRPADTGVDRRGRKERRLRFVEFFAVSGFWSRTAGRPATLSPSRIDRVFGFVEKLP